MDQCRELMNLLEKEFPNDERLAVLSAGLLFREKKIAKSDDTLLQFINKNGPTNSRAMLALAQLRLTESNTKGAVQILENLIQSNPTYGKK